MRHVTTVARVMPWTVPLFIGGPALFVWATSPLLESTERTLIGTLTFYWMLSTVAEPA